MNNIEFKIGDEVEIIPASNSYSKAIGNITKQIDKDVFEVEYTTSNGITRTDRYYSQDLKPTYETKVLESLRKMMNETTYEVSIKGVFKCKLKFPDGTIKEDDVELYGTATTSGYYDSNIYGVDPENAVGGYELNDIYDFDPENFEITLEQYEKYGIDDEIEILEIMKPVYYETEVIGVSEDDRSDRDRDDFYDRDDF